MARNTGRFNRLLELIGLVDDEPEEEKAPAASASTRRASARENRSRYGATSSEASSYTSFRSRSGYSASSFGSSGRAASLSREGYRNAPRPVSSFRSQEDPFERYPSDERSRVSSRQEPEIVDELEFEPTPAPAPAPARRSAAERRRENAAPARQMPSGPRADSRHHMIVYYLHTLDECRDVISDLLEGKSVLLNLEDMDDRYIQRAIDTLGGAAFALNATLRKASDRTYLIAPTSVDIAYTNDYDR